MRILRRILAIPVLVALAAGVVACGEDHPAGVVRIGVNDIAQPHWDVYQRKAAEQGITVEYVNFTDYRQPNPALAQKRVDLNKFQHVRYLANYNVANNDTLVPIGATEIFPLTLYSKKHKAVADIPRGGQITLSNNPAQQVIYTDDPARPELKQYINVFAARAADKDNPTYLKLAQLYHDPEVVAAVRAETGYAGIFKTNDPADLQATLRELEAKFRK